MMRLSFTVAACLLPCLATSGCDDQCNMFIGPCTPSCPENPEHGSMCEWADQRCVPQDSKCAEIEQKSTSCTCTNQSGGFRWDCKVKHCSCTCPCGVLATASCDAVGCSEPEDECPVEAAPFCEIHCGDGGTSDGGISDGGDGGSSFDIAADVPITDTAGDVMSDTAGDVMSDTAGDVMNDTFSTDSSADVSSD